MSALGIQTTECQEIQGQGAGGATKYYFWPDNKIRGRVGEWKIELAAWFSATSVPLLGREDFFAAFSRITFDERSRSFTLEV